MLQQVVAVLAALVVLPFSFTPLPPGDDARIVYVSSSQGDDANDGLSPSSPKATIGAGFGLLRDGHGDHLLLRRGDTFERGSLMWNKSGSSADEPMVFGAYGSGPRPIWDTGTGGAIVISPGFQSPNTVRHVAITDIHFYASGRDPHQPGFTIGGAGGAAGISIVGTQTTAPELAVDILIEGNVFERFSMGIVLNGGPNGQPNVDVRIRRNAIIDTWNDGHSSGMYINQTRDLLVEENLIDRVKTDPALPTIVANSMDHGIYQQSTNTGSQVIRGNVFANSFDGAMMRSGGVFEDNVVFNVDIGVHVGFIWGGTTPVPGGVDSTVRNNLFVEEYSVGTALGHVSSGAFLDNLYMPSSHSGPQAFNVLAMAGSEGNVGVHDTTIAGNVVLGPRGFNITNTLASNVTIEDNHISTLAEVGTIHSAQPGVYDYSGNHYQRESGSPWFRIGGSPTTLASWVAAVGDTGHSTGAVAPTISDAPSITDYHAAIGGAASVDAFLAGARQQSRTSWNDAYTAESIIDWFRIELGLDPSSPPPPPPPDDDDSEGGQPDGGDDTGPVHRPGVVGPNGPVIINTSTGQPVPLQTGAPNPRRLVAVSERIDGNGTWAADPEGRMYTTGIVPHRGDMGGTRLNRPVLGMTPTATGNGYWMVAADGGIFTFGDARFYGSMGGVRLNQPVTGLAVTRTGAGYVMVASDGGVFTFGDARFYGSMGHTRLNRPINGIAMTPSGNGYWMVASDGGVFSFGDARFYGSLGGTRLDHPVIGMIATDTGRGYWLIDAVGRSYAFGDAR